MAAVFVYGLCEPNTNIIRYVGKALDVNNRVRLHLAECKNKSINTRKANWLRSLGSVKPDVIILEETNSEDWQEVERRWIADFRYHGHDLTNYADGGETSPLEGKHHTKATKELLRKKALERGLKPPSQKGFKFSEEQKEKCRKSSLRRGAMPPRRGGWNKGLKQTHCINGHAFTNTNTRICHRRNQGRTYQVCKICEKAAIQRYELNKRR